MSTDKMVTFRAGEKKIVDGIVPAPSGGTITLQAGGTFTLKAQDGTVLLNAVPITGRDTSALAAPRAWYLLDTTGMAAGSYYAVFALPAVGSDGTTDLFEPEALVQVLAAIEATYDASRLASSALFQTRFHCADTNTGAPIWSDSELLFCLSLADNVPELAAARALRAAASDAARLAVITGLGQVKNDETEVYTALLAMADALEAQAASGGAVGQTDVVFTLDSAGGARLGTMHIW